MICKRCGKKLKKILLDKEFIEKIGIINNNYNSSNEVLKPNIINNLNIDKEKFYNIILKTMNKKSESLFLSKKIERENNLDGFEKIKGEYYTHDN